MALALLLAAKVWHYWLSYAIIAGVLLTFVALGIGYLVKVTANRYPKQ
jgi:protein-S-isoprenylcysteine O-methyltransferase Ste14